MELFLPFLGAVLPFLEPALTPGVGTACAPWAFPDLVATIPTLVVVVIYVAFGTQLCYMPVHTPLSAWAVLRAGAAVPAFTATFFCVCTNPLAVAPNVQVTPPPLSPVTWCQHLTATDCLAISSTATTFDASHALGNVRTEQAALIRRTSLLQCCYLGKRTALMGGMVAGFGARRGTLFDEQGTEGKKSED